WLSVDWAGTLDAALWLQPDTHRVVVITGNAGIDRVWQDAARRQLGDRYNRVSIEYLPNLPVDYVVQRVAALSKGTIVLFGAFSRDATGQNLIGAEVVRRVAASAGVPVYAPVETYVGGGVVGGSVVSFSGQGERAAALAASVLNGNRTQPHDDRGANAYVFDWRQLQRWGLDDTQLPPGSDVRFKQPSAWELHKW